MIPLKRAEFCRISGIYSIKSLSDDRVYIGSAISLYDRCMNHLNRLVAGTHYNTKLQRFVNKYGIDKLSFNVIELVPNKEDLILREQFYIDSNDSYKKGFNNSPTAGNTLGVVFTEERRRKIGDKSIGRTRTKESKEKQSLEAMGRHAGEKHPNVLLTLEQVLLIKKLHYLGYSSYIIKNFLGLKLGTVANIVTRNRWKHVELILPTSEETEYYSNLLGKDTKKVSKLSIEDVIFIKTCPIESADELSKKFKVTPVHIRNIINGKAYKKYNIGVAIDYD